MSLSYPLIGFSFCFLTFMEAINRCFLHSCTRHSGSLQAHCEAVILTESVPPDSSCIAEREESQGKFERWDCCGSSVHAQSAQKELGVAEKVMFVYVCDFPSGKSTRHG